MDRNRSPLVPRVYMEAQPSMIFLRADPANFMEIVQRYTGQTAPNNAAAAAAVRDGAMLPTATAPGPRASSLMLQLTLAPPLSTGNPGPCVLNMPPDPRSLATSSSETESTFSEDDEEMEDNEAVEAIKEGRFYLLPSPQNEEPKLLNLFPLAPSSTEGN